MLPAEYGGPIVLTAEKRAVTVKDTLVAKLNHQAVLMHFKKPGQAQLLSCVAPSAGEDHALTSQPVPLTVVHYDRGTGCGTLWC